MRVSYLSILAILPLSLAVPIHKHPRDIGGILGDIANGAAKLINPNATAAGIVGTVEQSIENPALTGARIDVVKSLGDTNSALNKVNAQATSTNNAGVQSLVTQAQSGLSAAQSGVGNIATDLLSGTTPSKTDQKNVAVGIHNAETAINGMAGAITTPDQTLSSNIADAVSSVDSLKTGGESVLAASNLTLADLGLPESFAD
ncbi:hypothetical protein K439DRAFT_397036 [Ramaria rubella]|nr:hypothetical protein K439DRAFT_397036 [Ramaria rubella]